MLSDSSFHDELFYFIDILKILSFIALHFTQTPLVRHFSHVISKTGIEGENDHTNDIITSVTTDIKIRGLGERV